MERMKEEVGVVEMTLSEVAESHLYELSNLQLALVGGGAGETVYQ